MRNAWIPALMAAGTVIAACGPIASPKPNPTPSAQQVKSATPKMMRHGRRFGMRRWGAMNGAWIRMSSRVKAESLTTLPSLMYIRRLNPWTRRAVQVSGFITGMGYHWMTPYPALVLMTNQAGLVTGVEATFPQKLGSFAWDDPPTTVPNAGVALNSEHLYFIAPSSITPTMTATTSDLTSWSAFQSVNTRLSSYSKMGTFMGFTVYAPPGPGIHVLVSPSGTIAGFATAEPAAFGFHPFYYPRPGQPTTVPMLGKVYWSILLLQPVKPGATGGTP